MLSCLAFSVGSSPLSVVRHATDTGVNGGEVLMAITVIHPPLLGVLGEPGVRRGGVRGVAAASRFAAADRGPAREWRASMTR
ncbi:hypothetical protein [Streptomyces zaomyceticus]|uniref:hypothetical protein n=1 Tax=Streptomyces zaomyceticus TaxID=68286 RepID=UPI0036A0422D